MPSKRQEPDTDEEVLRLTVVEARREDIGRGIVRVDPNSLKQIHAAPGDILTVQGRTRTTVAKAMPTFRDQRGQAVIQMDGVARVNAGAALGQQVSVSKSNHHLAQRVALVPIGSGAIHEDELDHMARRLDGLAVQVGDRVRAALFGATYRDFQVSRTEPGGPVLIQPDTLLVVERARSDAPQTDDIIMYDDLGGMEQELRKIREMIELPLSIRRSSNAWE